MPTSQMALLTGYEQLGRIEDLEEVITYCRDALTLCPPGHPDRSSSLHNLAIAVLTRHEQLGRMEDLEEVITYLREALTLRPPGHPDRSSSLVIVGLTYGWGEAKDNPGLQIILELWRRVQLWQLTVSISVLRSIHVGAYGESESITKVFTSSLTSYIKHFHPRSNAAGRRSSFKPGSLPHGKSNDNFHIITTRTFESVPDKNYPIPSVFRRALIDSSVIICPYFFAMSISSKIKRYYRRAGTDLSREQHTPEPGKNSTSNSYNSTTSGICNWKVASRQLESIQSQIKAKTKDCPIDSDEIPPISQAPKKTSPFKFRPPPSFPLQSRAARKRMIAAANSRSQTLRSEYISANRKGKRRRTEDTLNPKPDRTGEETDEFVYFLYFLAFCVLIFFLISLLLLSVIFLSCLYVVHLSYK